MQPHDSVETVRRGYDAMANRYLAWAKPSPTRARYLAMLRQLLPAHPALLEIGCGAGVPVARDLATLGHVTGVDVSATQLALARGAVPGATFIEGDITALDFPAAAFDAVVAFFAITHIPRVLHVDLFTRIARWLRPGGVLVASLGANDTPDEIEPDWLGVPMFFSHFDAATNQALLEEAGFQLEHAEVVAEDEDGVAVPFLWVLARRVKSAPTSPCSAADASPERP